MLNNKRQGGDTMQSITIKIRFFPKQSHDLKILSRKYIQVINSLTERAEKEGSFPKITSKDVESILPSAVLNQAIRDAKSVFRKAKKEKKRPILKKPVYYLDNQNYSIGESSIYFPHHSEWQS
jgi:putative transposase